MPQHNKNTNTKQNSFTLLSALAKWIHPSGWMAGWMDVSIVGWININDGDGEDDDDDGDGDDDDVILFDQPHDDGGW